MSFECNELHQIVNNLDLKSYPFTPSDIPKNGIYVLFEEGEKGHSGNRIVRVGINRGQGNLYQRLTEHYVKMNKDRSIFRKNIGLAILNAQKDQFIEKWKIDLTTHASRQKHKELVQSEELLRVEKEVSEIIQRNFSFIVIQVDDPNERIGLESALISTVAHCEECGPSKQWLGLRSPKKKIRESGLWQEQGMNDPIVNIEHLTKYAQAPP